MKTRQKVKILLESGRSYSDVGAKLGISKATVAYHAKSLGLDTGSSRKKYDWVEIQDYYSVCRNVTACLQHFGVSRAAWYSALSKGWVITLTRAEKFLVEGRTVGGHTLRRALLDVGVPYKCSCCYLSDWQGQPITLQVDHIDGDPENNKIDNLRFLCPNCHSQTETFAGKNHKRLRS